MSAATLPSSASLPTFLPPPSTPPQPVGTDPSGAWLIFENALCHGGQWYNIVIQKFDLATNQVIPFDRSIHQLPIDAPTIVQTSVELILRSLANANVVNPLTPDRVGLVYATDGNPGNDQFKVIEADSAFQTIGQAGLRKEFHTLVDRSVEPKKNSWDGEGATIAPADRNRFEPDGAVSDMSAISRMRRIWDAVSPARALHTAGTLQLSAMPAGTLSSLRLKPSVGLSPAVDPLVSSYVKPAAAAKQPMDPVYRILDAQSAEYARLHPRSFLEGIKWGQLQHLQLNPQIAPSGNLRRAKDALDRLAANPLIENDDDCDELFHWLCLHNRSLRQFYLDGAGQPYYDEYLVDHEAALRYASSNELVKRETFARDRAAFDVLRIAFPNHASLLDSLRNDQ